MNIQAFYFVWGFIAGMAFLFVLKISGPAGEDFPSRRIK